MGCLQSLAGIGTANVDGNDLAILDRYRCDVLANNTARKDVWHCYDYQLENVAFSGGGMKGYAYIGAIQALDDAGVLAKIRRIAGTSAGAICAGLLSVGCTPQEIADVFKGDVKKLFHDQSCICCCGLPKIYRRFGINSAERFKRIYGEHIARKTGNPNITFGEVYKEYGRELCIVVTNLSQMRSEFFHYTTTPDLPIKVAVRMSMSFPVIFEPIWYDVNGTLDLYCDGGVLNQYPIHCFDGPDLELNHNSETDEIRINEKTIGLYVVSERAVDHKIWQQLFGEKIPTKPTYIPNTKLARTRLNEELAKWKRVQKLKKVDKEEIKSDARQQKLDALQQNIHYEATTTESVSIGHFADFMQATLETILVAQRKASVKPEDLRRTVAINCGYIGTNDYVIEPGDREFMIQQGYLHTVDYLKDYVQRARTKQREGCHLARSKGSTSTFKSLSSIQTVV